MLDEKDQEPTGDVGDSSAPASAPAEPTGLVDNDEGGTLYLDELESPQAVPAPEAAPAPAPEEPAKPQRNKTALNVRQKFVTYKPVPEKNVPPEMIILPAGTNEEINEAIEASPNVRLDDTVNTREWAEALNGGTDIAMIGSALHGAVDREGSMWEQDVLSEKGGLAGKAPEFRDRPGVSLSGERAVLRMRALLGQGSVFQVPLWHSGFWVTFKAPSDGALLELQRRILQEKVNLGRHVHGLAFSNHSSYIAGWLTDFALSHVYDTTVEGSSNEDLRKLIVGLDIPSLLWGMACVVWVSGFQYAQACANDPAKCNHVIKELLDVTKLQWTDNRALTPWQIGHMAGRNTKMTMDSITKYRNEFTVGKPRKVPLADGISVTLKSPSLEQYLTSGNRWVASIVEMVDKAFGLSPEDGQRNAFISEQGQASIMRQFSHWVEEIDLGNDTVIADQETLEMALNSLSGRPDIVDTYLTQVGKFMDDSTVAVIAIPAHECPKCQTPRESGMPRYPQLLPIDVMSTFFTLLGQKATLIRRR